MFTKEIHKQVTIIINSLHFMVPTMCTKVCTNLINDRELLDIAINICKTFHWIPKISFQRLLFDYAVSNNIYLPNKHYENQLVDLVWTRKYIDTNKQLISTNVTSRQIPMALMHFTLPKEVTNFMTMLSDLAKTDMYNPDEIYNVDEIGILVAHGENEEIMASLARKLHDEKPLLSVINAVNARGRLVPPFFVTKRKYLSTVIENSSPQMTVCVTESDDIDEKDFANWLRHFKDFAKPSAQKPVYLVMDNNYYHICLDAYDYCQKHFIRLLVLPPHTWVRMYPLEILFHDPMKLACQLEADNYVKENIFSDAKIEIANIVRFYTKAFYVVRSSVTKNCAQAFQTVGIYPADENKFAKAIKSNISKELHWSQMGDVWYVNCIVRFKHTINRCMKRSLVVRLNSKFEEISKLRSDRPLDHNKRDLDTSIDSQSSQRRANKEINKNEPLSCDQENQKILSRTISKKQMVSAYTQTDKPKLEKKILPPLSISPDPLWKLHEYTENTSHFNNEGSITEKNDNISRFIVYEEDVLMKIEIKD